MEFNDYAQNSTWKLLNKKRDLTPIENMETRKENIIVNNQLTVNNEGRIVEIQPGISTSLPEVKLGDELKKKYIETTDDTESIIEQIVRPYEFSEETMSIKFKFIVTSIIEWDGITINFIIKNPNPNNFLQVDGSLESLISELILIVDDNNLVERNEDYAQKAFISRLLTRDKKNGDLNQHTKEVLLDPKEIGSSIVFNPSRIYIDTSEIKRIENGKISLLECGYLDVSLPLKARLFGNQTFHKKEKHLHLTPLIGRQITCIIKFNPEAFFVPVFNIDLSDISNYTMSSDKVRLRRQIQTAKNKLKGMKESIKNKFNKESWVSITKLSNVKLPDGTEVLPTDVFIATMKMIGNNITIVTKDKEEVNSDYCFFNENNNITSETILKVINIISSGVEIKTDEKTLIADIKGEFFQHPELNAEGSRKIMLKNVTNSRYSFNKPLESNSNQFSKFFTYKVYFYWDFKDQAPYKNINFSEDNAIDISYYIGEFSLNELEINFKISQRAVTIFSYKNESLFIVPAIGSIFPGKNIKHIFSPTEVQFNPITFFEPITENFPIANNKIADDIIFGYKAKEMYYIINGSFPDSFPTPSLFKASLKQDKQETIDYIYKIYMGYDTNFNPERWNILVKLSDFGKAFENTPTDLLVKYNGLSPVINVSRIVNQSVSIEVEKSSEPQIFEMIWDVFGDVSYEDWGLFDNSLSIVENRIRSMIELDLASSMNDLSYIKIKNDMIPASSLIYSFRSVSDNVFKRGIKFIKNGFKAVSRSIKKVASLPGAVLKMATNFLFGKGSEDEIKAQIKKTFSFIISSLAFAHSKMNDFDYKETFEIICYELIQLLNSLSIDSATFEALLKIIETDDIFKDERAKELIAKFLTDVYLPGFEYIIEEVIIKGYHTSLKSNNDEMLVLRNLIERSGNVETIRNSITLSILSIDTTKVNHFRKKIADFAASGVIIPSFNIAKVISKTNSLFSSEAIDDYIKSMDEEIERNYTNQSWENVTIFEAKRELATNILSNIIQNDRVSRKYIMIDPFIKIRYKPLNYVPSDSLVYQPFYKKIDRFLLETGDSITLLIANENSNMILFFTSDDLSFVPTCRKYSLRNINVSDLTFIINDKFVYPTSYSFGSSSNSQENSKYLRLLEATLKMKIEETSINPLNYSIGYSTNEFISKIISGRQTYPLFNGSEDLGYIYINNKFGFFNEVTSGFVIPIPVVDLALELGEPILTIKVLLGDIKSQVANERLIANLYSIN